MKMHPLPYTSVNLDREVLEVFDVEHTVPDGELRSLPKGYADCRSIFATAYVWVSQSEYADLLSPEDAFYVFKESPASYVVYGQGLLLRQSRQVPCVHMLTRRGETAPCYIYYADPFSFMEDDTSASLHMASYFDQGMYDELNENTAFSRLMAV